MDEQTLARIRAQRDARLKQRDDNNAELNKTRQMSQHDRSMRAVDTMAGNLVNDARKMGKDMSFSEAREKAVQIAETADRKYRS